MEDAVILKKLSSRDQSGLSELKAKHGRLIKTVCRSILKSPQDVEEAENDVLLAAWESIPRDNPENLTAYICKLARRISINKLRYNTAAVRNSDLLTELDECLPSGYSTEDAAENAELSEALNSWLRQQSVKQQRLFVLRYFYMQTTKEAAKACSMSQTAVTTALARLRASLKQYLIERGMFYE